MPAKKRKQAGVSTGELAAALACSVDQIYRFRELGVFKRGRKLHYWAVNPLATRPTYRWNKELCIKALEELENK